MYNKEEFKQVVENAVKEIFPDREVTTLVEDRSQMEQLCVETKAVDLGSKDSDAKEAKHKKE